MIPVLKTIWIYSWAGLLTLVLFLPVTLSAFLGSTGNLAFVFCKIWAGGMLWAARVRVRVIGAEKIEKGRAYVIMASHQSHFDIPALMMVPYLRFRWIIKKELRKIPLFGLALDLSHNIFIDRSNLEAAIASIDRGMDRLPPGVGVLFFPEGSRSGDGRIQEFKKGGFVLAIDRNLSILPIAINGSRRVMPKGALSFKPGLIEVVVDDPIETARLTRVKLDELARTTRTVILANFKPEFP